MARSRKKSRFSKFIQVALVLALIAAAARLAYIFRGRLQPAKRPHKAAKAPPLNRDAYVVPRKLHAYDLASSRALTRQPVWVQEGYRYTYYAYDPSRRRADLAREAGRLGPIEELHINNVVAQPTPGQPNYHQILAVFDRAGRHYAVPVGTESGGSFQIYADQMFFYEDPHQLYSFWPAEVWDAIGRHQVTPGMNEIQADFAVGMGVPEPRQSDSDEKVVKYANDGHPLTVTYRKGRAVKIAGQD